MSSSVAVAVFKTRLTTKLLRQFLFAISQFCRSVSDLTDEDVAAASPFHSVDEPAVELPDYALGVARSLHLNKQTVFLAMAYLSLYSQKSSRLPSILSVHRLFASALLLATRTSQPDSSVADVSFASASGLSVTELLDLVAILRRIVGTADVPDDVLSTLFARLEDASSKTLRRDITEAVACAFQVSLPRTRKNNNSVALVFPKSPCTAASTPNNSDSGWWLSAGSSNHSSFYTLQGSSTHSSFHHAPPSPAHDAQESSSGSFAAGSASSAARSLRRHLSTLPSDSVVVTVTPPILPLPTFEQLRLEPEVPVVIPPTPPTSGRSGIVRLPPSFGRR